MSFTVKEQLEALKVPFEAMNPVSIRFYVQQLNEGKALSPGKERLARAIIELEEAYATQDHWKFDDSCQWPASDEEMLAQAIAAFKGGSPHPIHWGVRQEYLPRGSVEGDHVIIHEFFMGERSVIEGEIVKVIEYPNSTGWVIQPKELIDRYVYFVPPLKYMSLWASHDRTSMAGFLVQPHITKK